MTDEAKLALVGDIGGTHARFALVDPGAAPAALREVAVLRTADFPDLEAACAHYLARTGARPRRAALAVAGPVGGDAVRLTNLDWEFSQTRLARALGLKRLLVLNDFGAVARAVPALAGTDRVVLQGEADAPLAGPVSVLGPGTGLGVALLVGEPGRGWRVVETEGGHVGFAPQDDEEIAIARSLRLTFGRASNERVLSGPGLARIDAVLAAGTGGAAAVAIEDALLREPAAIVAAALGDTDARARRALARFCAVLGSVAGDTALIHGARTLVLAGGIVPRILPFLATSAFRERFLAKGRFAARLEAVVIHVITHPQPGLLGAAQALHARR